MICLLFRSKRWKETIVVAFVIKVREWGLTKVFRGDQRIRYDLNHLDMIFAHKIVTVDRTLVSREMPLHNNTCTL